jgi:urease accessory protein UreF
MAHSEDPEDEGADVELSVKRKVAIGATVAVVLGGGGAAYAVTKANDGGRQAFLGDVAHRLNVTPEQLNNAIKGATEDRIQAAVKAGKLTQAQADQIKKKIEAAPAGVPFGGPGLAMGAAGPRFFFRVGGPGGPIRDGINAASNYLGLSKQQLMNKLSSGKSLADIAGEQNKSVDGLKSAISDSVKSRLDKAVKAGKLTQTQENNLLSKLNSTLGDLVNQKGLPPAVGFGFRGGQVLRAGPGLLFKSGLDSAAKYLGLSSQQLVQKLSSGKSLAQIAGEQNKSVDGLKSAITNSVKSNLDSAVKAGKLTQAQENNIMGGLSNRLDKLVNGKAFVGPPGLMKRHAFGAKRGFHFRGAPAGGPPPGFPIF